jgi:sulfate adenylyltransferase subunit 1 (EFTu-like GTPase family)
MTTLETIKFVLIGHVDHGKSTFAGHLLYKVLDCPVEIGTNRMIFRKDDYTIGFGVIV